MMTKVYKRRICPAKIQLNKKRLNVIIEYTEDGELSFKIGAISRTCDYEKLLEDGVVPVKGYTDVMIQKICDYWRRWNKNYHKQGTPLQEEFVSEWLKTHKYDYSEICMALREVGLESDNGHRYGYYYCKEEVPDEVLKFLFELPALEGVSWNDVKPERIDEQEFLAIIS